MKQNESSCTTPDAGEQIKKEGLYINMTSGHVEVVKRFIPEDPAIYSQSQVDYLVALEREACAKVCEETKAPKIRDEWSAGQTTGCSSCAAAIRARGGK